MRSPNIVVGLVHVSIQITVGGTGGARCLSPYPVIRGIYDAVEIVIADQRVGISVKLSEKLVVDITNYFTDLDSTTARSRFSPTLGAVRGSPDGGVS